MAQMYLVGLGSSSLSSSEPFSSALGSINVVSSLLESFSSTSDCFSNGAQALSLIRASIFAFTDSMIFLVF